MKNLGISLEVLQAPPKKNCPRKQYFGCGACFQCTAETAQIWAREIILRAS